MRRLLNLNQSSMIFVKLIGLFVFVIPSVLYLLSFLLNENSNPILIGAIRISVEIGIAVMVVFLVLIVAEQIQDHWIDIQFQKDRDRKLPLADGKLECQYCGNQQVKENDKTCSVCGRVLK